MHTNVRTIKPTEPVSRARELFRLYDINHLVVVNKGSVLGVVADRDLIDIDDDTPVQRAMVHPPVTISPSRSPMTSRTSADRTRAASFGLMPIPTSPA